MSRSRHKLESHGILRVTGMAVKGQDAEERDTCETHTLMPLKGVQQVDEIFLMG